MTRWSVSHGDILNTPAEGLICSANPSLNLSGGVGGAFLLRFGDAMQTWLHNHLRDNQLRFIPPSQAIIAPACGSPYKAVAHAVAIDAFYETRPEWIIAAYESAIASLAAAGCQSIAAACLGCGYGRCSTDNFVTAVRPLLARSFSGVDQITFVTTSDDLVEALTSAISSVSSATPRSASENPAGS